MPDHDKSHELAETCWHGSTWNTSESDANMQRWFSAEWSSYPWTGSSWSSPAEYPFTYDSWNGSASYGWHTKAVEQPSRWNTQSSRQSAWWSSDWAWSDALGRWSKSASDKVVIEPRVDTVFPSPGGSKNSQLQPDDEKSAHSPLTQSPDKGVKILSLSHNGQEAPAWMMNGPDYKIIDMDAERKPESNNFSGSPHQRPPLPVNQVVADLESIAQSVGKSNGRSFKDVALDAKTKRCCSGLTSALEETGEIDRTLLSLLVRASIALAKIRIIHQLVLDGLARADPERLQAIDTSRLVELLWSFAVMHVREHPATQFLIATLDANSLRQLSPLLLANLCWACATLGVQRIRPELPEVLVMYVNGLDLQSVPWLHLARIVWGLGKLIPSPDQVPSWAVRLKGALESGRPKIGPTLSDAFWVLSHWNAVDAMQRLASRCPDESLGRDVYGICLRALRHDELLVSNMLRQMAKHLAAPGLKAAVLNSALIQLIRIDHRHDIECVLHDMTNQGLWTPITYQLVARLDKRETLPAGRPPAPGRVDPGQSAHKYTKAVYHAIERSQTYDADTILRELENFSQEQSWLKFGAEGKKGGVIDAVVHNLSKKSVIVEFGTFIGYSSIRIAKQLGEGCRIITIEMDPEVASLAENLILFAGLESCIEVWLGSTEDIIPRLCEAVGSGGADLVYMDHNQGIYHEDVCRLESAGIIRAGTTVIATQVLKPGAPLLAWHFTERQRLGQCDLDLVSSPDCGCPMMEEWVAVARYIVAPHEHKESIRTAPESLQKLARICNLMRWRTAQGLVDEKKWNCFVQYVRAGMEFADIASTRHVWEPLNLSKARQFRYIPLDY